MGRRGKSKEARRVEILRDPKGSLFYFYCSNLKIPSKFLIIKTLLFTRDFFITSRLGYLVFSCKCNIIYLTVIIISGYTGL